MREVLPGALRSDVCYLELLGLREVLLGALRSEGGAMWISEVRGRCYIEL